MAKVLIIDDEEASNRILVSALLTNAGHQAVDAIEALAIVRADHRIS